MGLWFGESLQSSVDVGICFAWCMLFLIFGGFIGDSLFFLVQLTGLFEKGQRLEKFGLVFVLFDGMFQFLVIEFVSIELIF
jgi:hypothetical protein